MAMQSDLRVPVRMTVEPRTTLLDALRDELGLTGTKRAGDRARFLRTRLSMLMADETDSSGGASQEQDS